MKFIKKIRYDEHALLYADKTDPVLWVVLSAVCLVSSAVIASAVAAYARGFAAALTGSMIAGVFFVCGSVALWRLIYRLRYPYNAVADDEHLFIRKGSGYIRFHKFEIGSVTYRDGASESAAAGNGSEKFLVEPKSVTFQNAIKPIKRKLQNGEKLAYVLLQTVQTPQSGVNWSLAYESLPKNKRSPNAF